MLALAKYRESRCPRCDGDLAETTDPANRGRYVPLDAVCCYRCDGLIVAEQRYAKVERPGALLHAVQLRRPTSAAGAATSPPPR